MNLEQEVQQNQALKSTFEERENAAQELRDTYRTLNAKFLEQSEDLRTLIAQTEALQKSKVFDLNTSFYSLLVYFKWGDWKRLFFNVTV